MSNIQQIGLRFIAEKRGGLNLTAVAATVGGFRPLFCGTTILSNPNTEERK